MPTMAGMSSPVAWRMTKVWPGIRMLPSESPNREMPQPHRHPVGARLASPSSGTRVRLSPPTRRGEACLALVWAPASLQPGVERDQELLAHGEVHLVGVPSGQPFLDSLTRTIGGGVLHHQV